MKLENISTETKYSITINPSDRIQYYSKPGRLNMIHKRMVRIVNSMKHWCDVELYPEYSFSENSHATKSEGPRLHYHGTIQIKDLDYFLELGYTALKDVSQFEIDTIEDPDVWDTYCKKGQSIMKPMYAFRGIPYKLSSKKVKECKKKTSIQDYWEDRVHPDDPLEERS